METPSNNPLPREVYSAALNDLVLQDIARQAELLDLLKNKKINPEEFVIKTQERDHEFHQKHFDIIRGV